MEDLRSKFHSRMRNTVIIEQMQIYELTCSFVTLQCSSVTQNYPNCTSHKFLFDIFELS